MATMEAPPKGGLQVEVVLLTPELAREWITYNTGNRKVIRKHVDRLSGAMRRGEYVAGAAMPIAFTGTPDAPGRLLNGQHHLHAVIDSGETVTVLVVWGLPEVAQTVMDQGANRTLADTLAMDGEQYGTAIAAGLRGVYAHRVTGVIGKNPPVTATVTQLLALLESEPRIRESAMLAARLIQEGRTFGLRALVPLHYYLLRAGCVEEADEFMRRAVLGVHTEVGDPIQKLRRWYLDARGRGTAGTYQTAGLMVKAWNAWITGAEVRSLSFRAGGSEPEAFPTIIIPEKEESA